MAVTSNRRAALRKFGVVTGLMIGIMFGLVLPWVFSIGRWPWMPWAIGGALLVLGLIAPQSLDLIEKYWMKAAHKLGFFNMMILLTIVYVVVLTPTGWLMRLFGKDPMNRRFDPEATTYREVSETRPKDHMKQSF
ncbi:MAG: hypothetical protein ACI9OJ_002471 [Myxococcota bacterium]|jgi:hypothetical protein